MSVAALRAELATDPDLCALADCVDQIPKEVDSLWKTNQQSWFTDHGPNHSRRTAELALKIVQFSSIHPDKRLSALETFILWAAAWLHDIGMQDLIGVGTHGAITRDGYDQVRREHPERTAIRLLQGWPSIQLLGAPGVLETIAGVARAHGTAYYNETINTHLQDKRYLVGNHEVRPRLLAAILLFADELDLTYLRVSKPSGWVESSPVSEAHQYKHSCVEAVLPTCEDGMLKISLQLIFPQALSKSAALAIQRWIEVKLRRQMGMIEKEFLNGFGQVRLNRIIETSIVWTNANMPQISPAALNVIMAETAMDDLMNHRSAFSQVISALAVGGMVIVSSPSPTAGDGRSDLLEAAYWSCVADGTPAIMSRRARVNLGGSAADILSDWASEIGVALPYDAAGDEGDSRSSFLGAILDNLRSSGKAAHLFIDGAELLDDASIRWLVETAFPALKAACEARLILTGPMEELKLDADLPISVVPMGDTNQSDVAAYLGRTVDHTAAVAAAGSFKYEDVKNFAQRGELQLRGQL